MTHKILDKEALNHRKDRPMSKGLGDRLTEDIINLTNDLREDLVTLQYIKVDRLPVLDGKEVDSIYGIPFRTHVYEDEADYWRTSPPNNDKGEL